MKDAKIIFTNDDVEPKAIIKETALDEKGESADDIIKETNKTI